MGESVPAGVFGALRGGHREGRRQHLRDRVVPIDLPECRNQARVRVSTARPFERCAREQSRVGEPHVKGKDAPGRKMMPHRGKQLGKGIPTGEMRETIERHRDEFVRLPKAQCPCVTMVPMQARAYRRGFVVCTLRKGVEHLDRGVHTGHRVARARQRNRHPPRSDAVFKHLAPSAGQSLVKPYVVHPFGEQSVIESRSGIQRSDHGRRSYSPPERTRCTLPRANCRMNQIDRLIAHLQRFDAAALIAASDAPVVIRTAEGDRTSAQVLDHAQVVAIVSEVAPAAVLTDLKSGHTARFAYDAGPSAVSVDVVPTPGAWKATISLQAARQSLAPRLSAPPAQASAPQVSVSPARRLSVDPPARQGSMVSIVPGPPGLPRMAESLALRPSIPPDSRLIDRLLRSMATAGASDLHLSTGCPPLVRLHGEILRMEDAPPWTDENLRTVLNGIVPPRNREEFERRRDTDFGYEIQAVARFRVNMFLDRNGIGAVFRRIPFEIVSAEQLGLPPAITDFCALSKGLVLVTGPTGSGKSTTLAAMIDKINTTRDEHVITIEDPIEFVHSDKRCLINQREVKLHTDSFRAALRAALRQDPDIVLVGEMRDLETIEIAIETAETGHLVFGTLHTSTAPSTVDRMIDQFPAERQAQVRTMLSESLKGVVAQTLCKRIGGGRVAAYEILVGNPAVANLIREGKTYQLYGQMQGSRNVGMVTLGDALGELVANGLIEPREAYLRALNKVEIRTILQSLGAEVPE